MTERQESYKVESPALPDMEAITARYMRRASEAMQDLDALVEYIKQLRIALFEEQRARWQAEQDAQRWREEAEALRVYQERAENALLLCLERCDEEEIAGIIRAVLREKGTAQ